MPKYNSQYHSIGSCVHHDGFLYDSAEVDLTIYTQSEVAKFLSKLERKPIDNSDRREKFERQKTKFKWICCDETFTSGHKGGCKKGKHGFTINGNDARGRQLVDGMSNRLNQATIQQWEEACCANEEYNEKWLSLANE
jgi:hypothetical protein